MTTGTLSEKKSALTLLILAGSVLLASLGISIASVAQPLLSQVFSAPLAVIKWVVLGYLTAVTVSIVFAGRCADRWGYRQVLLSGLMLFTLASIGCVLASTLSELIWARVIQGVAAAILMALPMAMIRDVVAKERTGSAMGLLGTVSALGTALGPSLGGGLIEAFGWQAAFIVLFVIAVLLLILACWALPIAPVHMPAITGSSDWLGLALLRDRLIASSMTANFLVTCVLMSTLVVGPFYLLFGLRLEQTTVGLVMAVGPITAALFGIPAGRLTDKFGTRRMMNLGLAHMIFSLLCLALLPRYFHVGGYILSLMLLTPGFQLFLAANSTAVMLAAKEQQRGTLSGLLGLSRNLGFMAGASIMATLFAIALGEGEIANQPIQAIGDAFTTTFLAAGGMALLALMILIIGRGLTCRT